MPSIIHYRHKCIGCNACVEIAMEFWRMSRKDGKATLIKSAEKKGIFKLSILPQDKLVNKIAAANCPPKIIQVLD